MITSQHSGPPRTLSIAVDVHQGEHLEHAQPQVLNGNAPAHTELAAGRRMTIAPQNMEKKKKKKRKRKTECWTPHRLPSRTKFTKITQAAIDNARNADPNQGRCLLENCEEGNQAAHVIRRATGTNLVYTFMLRLSIRSSDIYIAKSTRTVLEDQFASCRHSLQYLLSCVIRLSTLTLA
jgi:hypothetical protein